MSEGLTVLISSAGRRVQLVRLFQRAAARFGSNSRVIAIDQTALAPALHVADRGLLVAHCLSETFVSELAEICRANSVDLVIPTLDTELPVYAGARASLESGGASVLVSSPEAVAICASKLATHNWLVAYGFPSPRTTPISEASEWVEFARRPAVVKPDHGSASIGVHIVVSQAKLELLAVDDSLIAQDFVNGTEYTIDVFVARTGAVLGVVPRRRLEVRAGEVSKGITIRDAALERLASAIAARLPGARGPITIQVIVEEAAGDVNVIEINPRFAGGFPLSAHAGADFSEWALEELAYGSVRQDTNSWRAGVTMLRFDDAVFLEGDISTEGSGDR